MHINSSIEVRCSSYGIECASRGGDMIEEIFMKAAHIFANESCIIDSGASCHMTSHKD